MGSIARMSDQAPPSLDGRDLVDRRASATEHADENPTSTESPTGSEMEVSTPLVVVVAVAVAVGAVARFVTTSSLWLDEALSVNIAALPIDEIGGALRHDGHPPLYYVLLHFWIDLFGAGDVAVRAFSGIVALACLPLAYVAGRRRGGTAAGLVTLAVFATAPFAIRYGTETRMYSLMMLLVLVGYLLLDDIVVGAKRGPARLVGLAVVAAALLYTHYWSLWLLAAVGLGLLWGAWRTTGGDRRRRINALVALVVGGLAFLPWIPTLLYQGEHTGTPWAAPMRPFAAAAMALGDFGGGGFRDADLVGAVMFVLVLLALFGVAVDRWSIRLDLRTVEQYRREALVLVGTVAIALAVGFATGATFASRYTAAIFPLFVVLVAGGITRLSGKWVPIVVLVGLVLSTSMGIYWSVTFSRSQSAEIAAAVRATAQPGDLIVYCPDQLGPAGSRTMPDDVEQVRFPDLGDPRFVDWVDYEDRNAAADPDAVAERALARAEGRDVFVVWNGGYRTMEGRCEAFVAALAARRPGSQTLVAGVQADNFEPATLDRFPASP